MSGTIGNKNPNYKHGYSVDGKTHPLYTKAVHIVQRCYNENGSDYKHYGARGITVCDEWKNNKVAFIEWAISNGWRGVSFNKRINKYTSSVQFNKKQKHIGVFTTAIKAALLRDAYIVARCFDMPLNFPQLAKVGG